MQLLSPQGDKALERNYSLLKYGVDKGTSFEKVWKKNERVTLWWKNLTDTT